MLHYTELPSGFARKSVKWPILKRFSSKYPQLLKEVETTVKEVSTAVKEVEVAIKVKGSNASSSSNLNENSGSELQLLELQLGELKQIKLFLEVVTKLINNVNFIVNYK